MALNRLQTLFIAALMLLSHAMAIQIHDQYKEVNIASNRLVSIRTSTEESAILCLSYCNLLSNDTSGRHCNGATYDTDDGNCTLIHVDHHSLPNGTKEIVYLKQGEMRKKL